MGERIKRPPIESLRSYEPGQVILPFTYSEEFLPADIPAAYRNSRLAKIHHYDYAFKGMQAYVAAFADPRKKTDESEKPLGETTYKTIKLFGSEIVIDCPVILRIGFYPTTLEQYELLDNYVAKIDFGINVFFIECNGTAPLNYVKQQLQKQRLYHVHQQIMRDRKYQYHDVALPYDLTLLAPVRVRLMSDDDPGPRTPSSPTPIFVAGKELVTI